MNKKQFEELEERVEDLEDSLEAKLSPHFIVFFWLMGTIIVTFFAGLIFGDFYTEINEFEYTCDDIWKMIVLDEFPRFIQEIEYVDAFYNDRMIWSSSKSFKEDDFRQYYLVECRDVRNMKEERGNKQ